MSKTNFLFLFFWNVCLATNILQDHQSACESILISFIFFNSRLIERVLYVVEMLPVIHLFLSDLFVAQLYLSFQFFFFFFLILPFYEFVNLKKLCCNFCFLFVLNCPHLSLFFKYYLVIIALLRVFSSLY